MKHKGHTSSLAQEKREKLEKRRLQAGAMFAKGKRQADVVKKLGVSAEAAHKWHSTWKKKGLKGLKSKGTPGPERKLTPAKLKKVEKAILKGPNTHGYATDMWTLARIGAVIKKTTGVEHGSTHIWRTMKAIGWTNQKPKTRPAERNEEAIHHWKQYTLREIKKKPKNSMHASHS
jgi:transposase